MKEKMRNKKVEKVAKAYSKYILGHPEIIISKAALELQFYQMKEDFKKLFDELSTDQQLKLIEKLKEIETEEGSCK